MAIRLTYSNNPVTSSDSIKDFVEKYNDSSRSINVDLNTIKNSIDELNNNKYIGDLTSGTLDKVKSLGVSGNSTFNGDTLFKFGKNSSFYIGEKGFILNDNSNVSNGIKNSLVFVLDKVDYERNEIEYQNVHLTTDGLSGGQIIILRINDNANIYGKISVGLVGYEDEQLLELNPNRPSITLMKSYDGDDRFLVLSYPLIKYDEKGTSTDPGNPSIAPTWIVIE